MLICANDGTLNIPWINSGGLLAPNHKNMFRPLANRNIPSSERRDSEQRTAEGNVAVLTSNVCCTGKERVTNSFLLLFLSFLFIYYSFVPSFICSFLLSFLPTHLSVIYLMSACYVRGIDVILKNSPCLVQLMFWERREDISQISEICRILDGAKCYEEK